MSEQNTYWVLIDTDAQAYCSCRQPGLSYPVTGPINCIMVIIMVVVATKTDNIMMPTQLMLRCVLRVTLLDEEEDL